MSQQISIAAVQQSCGPNKTENLERSLRYIRQAYADGAQLVILPELHTTPYFCINQETGNFDLAESIPGPSTDTIAALAKELSVVIVASIFEKRSAGIYHNTAVIIENDGSIAGIYRKMHIPDDPGYNEKYYFTPGDLGFNPIQTSLGKLGVLVCWDQWFPEAARLMSLAGADLLIYPTAIGWNDADNEAECARQLDAWMTVQRGHAIANGLPLISCNRVGRETDGGDTFWGHSFICGPQGEILQQASKEESIISIELDLNHSEQVRQIWPFFRDRRIDAYSELLKRFK